MPCYVKPADGHPMEVMSVQVKTCAVEQEYELDYDVRAASFLSIPPPSLAPPMR